MNSLIFATASRLLLPLLLLFSLFLMLRGHQHPGGGFVAGLVAAAGFGLQALAHGAANAEKALRLNPKTLLAIGLALAALSGMPAVFAGHPFLTAVWFTASLPLIGHAGTPLLFDLGVFLVVLGGAMTIILTLRIGE